MLALVASKELGTRASMFTLLPHVLCQVTMWQEYFTRHQCWVLGGSRLQNRELNKPPFFTKVPGLWQQKLPKATVWQTWAQFTLPVKCMC